MQEGPTATIVRLRLSSPRPRRDQQRARDARVGDREVLEREARRLAVARRRLLRHPALESAPPSLARLPHPLHQGGLFEQLVRRTLVHPAHICAQHGHGHAYTDAGTHVCDDEGKHKHAARGLAAKVRAPAPPSLTTGPLWTLARAAGHDTRALSDRNILRAVVLHPLDFRHFGKDEILLMRLFEALKAPITCMDASTPQPTLLPEGFLHKNGSRKPVALVKIASVACENRRSTSRKTRGSSKCCFCPDPALFGGEELSEELLGPFVNARGRASLRVHFECACWAPQVFADARSGRLQRVYDEYLRGRQLRCFGCGTKGATVGCYVEKCKKTFHFRCLELAGVRKVDKYFAAFCAVHAHLADLESYQLMLEAATIADVASQASRRDTTHGLDTPHSKYTRLRRGETELIFSARAGICSHTGVFDSAKVLFSARRRTVLPLNQRLVVRDRPRRLRVSALDVATGRIAQRRYPSQRSEARKNGGLGQSTDEYSMASIIQKDYSAVLLLRNLELAPDHTADEILIKKSGATASRRCQGVESEIPSKCGKRIRSSDSQRKNCSQIPENQSQRLVHDDDTYEARSPAHAEQDVVIPDGEEPIDMDVDHAEPEVIKKPRLALRIPIREEGVTLLRQTRKHEELVRQLEDEERNRRKKFRDERLRKRKLKEEIMRQQASGLAVTPVGSPHVTDAELAPKIRSAWETFLDEQLPNERVVRPEDSVQCAMRNIARLWGLLTPTERASYEERAKQARHGLHFCGSSRREPAE
jgi:PHD-like zinc-binding domain